jgi:PBSX family phage terminase large subunit
MADLSTKQARSIIEALDTDRRVCLWHGAVRSGKTLASALAWLAYIRQAPPGDLAMIGKTKETLERNILGNLRTWAGPGAVRHTALSNRGTIYGRTVHMLGANDRKAESRIRGMTLAGTYVDEATLLPGSEYWDMLMSRHLTTWTAGAKVLATTNPAQPGHWLKKQMLDTGEALAWHFLLEDNPILTAQERADAARGVSGVFYRRNILGEWVAAEGAIYDRLDLEPGGANRTTWDRLPPLTGRYWLGMDYGDRNATHAVLLALGTDERLYVVGEWRHSGRESRHQMEQTEYEAALHEWITGGAGIVLGGRPLRDVWPERIAVDPSAAGFRNVLRNRGWSGLTEPSEKINPVRDGIRNVNSLIVTGRLVFVQGAAPVLEREMAGYAWDDKKDEDVPVKSDDHGPDALRYTVMCCRTVWRPWLAAQYTDTA